MSSEVPRIDPIEQVRIAFNKTIDSRIENIDGSVFDDEAHTRWKERIESFAIATFIQTQALLSSEQQALSAMEMYREKGDWATAASAAMVANTSLIQRIHAVHILRKLGADPIEYARNCWNVRTEADETLFLTWSNTHFPSLIIPEIAVTQPSDNENDAFWRGHLYGSEYK